MICLFADDDGFGRENFVYEEKENLHCMEKNISPSDSMEMEWKKNMFNFQQQQQLWVTNKQTTDC
ncbi:hypothetical protein DERP_000663 [Dermatophagoides pteronyssinus]|uniref:Uncharacterized protein n=1 Tax=Dermatophagoides pteronyssinus TaxID=6956 RepID=A0ABQ8J0T3_DERPT|nr:hypothetical protein DERP_000663 [Dermatophagoides pteronyssinus]